MVDTMIDGLNERISKAAKIHLAVGVIVPLNNYSDLFEALFSEMQSNKDDIWVYLTITKSFDTIIRSYKNIADRKNIKFIDCISRAAGISRVDKNCVYIESPVQLERIIIEIMHIFRDVGEGTKKFLVIDSVSALMIYNNPETVKEFFQHITNKTRAENIHTISLVVEEEMDEHINKIIFLNDKIIRVKESFI